MKAAGIIFSNLNNNTLSKLTETRTVAAIPFACRYRLVDFALSNMVNAGISDINIVTNYNYRSLIEHVGSGKDWDLARSRGGIHLISPYQTAKSAGAAMYSSHMGALRNISQSYIQNIQEEYVVLSDCDFVCNVNLSDVLARHESLNADVTVVTVAKAQDAEVNSHRLIVTSDENGQVTEMHLGFTPEKDNESLSTDIFVFKTAYLRQCVEEAERNDYKSLTKDILMRNAGKATYYVYRHTGYYAVVADFREYFACSITLAENPELRRSLIGVPERPVFTNVHNSAPTVYRSEASVKNSMIADGCVIEGTVENSVIFRGVRIKKGAVVKNSILFFGTEVGEDTSLNCVVTDKNAVISDGITLSGHPTIPFYIAKGVKI